MKVLSLVSMSTVYMLSGSSHPFSMTLSTILVIDLKGFDRRENTPSEINILTPYCFVAASNLAVVLTWGDK